VGSKHNSKLKIQYLKLQHNGFDLSLSFSLIAQSKAPLENYGTNMGNRFEILYVTQEKSAVV
jgi:hypothetical protein